MSPKRRRTNPNLQLAQELEVWGNSRSVAFDRYLQGLIDAFRKDEDLAFWSNYPPMEWLPRPRSHRARKMADIGRLIAIVRNVLIFAPVAITWLAIGMATRAFDEYIASGAAETANFLEFWQDGKGILADVWRIGNVATFDFQIILILIVLSFTAGVLQARAIRVSSRDNTKFEQERIKFALQIDEALRGYKVVTSENVSKSVFVILDKLNTAANGIASASDSIQKAANSLNPSLRNSSREVEKLVKKVNQVSSEVRTSANAAKRSLQSLSKASDKKKSKLK